MHLHTGIKNNTNDKYVVNIKDLFHILKIFLKES